MQRWPALFDANVTVQGERALEQFLGTLGQTAGYTSGEALGGEPWSQLLREGSAKSIVLVSNTHARLAVGNFESFAGGPNPHDTTTLPEGILAASRKGMFGRRPCFHGYYGWGSETDPNAKCSFSADPGLPISAGPNYTSLITSAHGLRGQICEGSSGLAAFSARLPRAIEASARLCEFELPPEMHLSSYSVRIDIAGRSLPYCAEPGSMRQRTRLVLRPLR